MNLKHGTGLSAQFGQELGVRLVAPASQTGSAHERTGSGSWKVETPSDVADIQT